MAEWKTRNETEVLYTGWVNFGCRLTIFLQVAFLNGNCTDFITRLPHDRIQKITDADGPTVCAPECPQNHYKKAPLHCLASTSKS